MSKDILGSLVRVLVTVPESRLGLVKDIAVKLSGDDGGEWEQSLKQFLRKEPCWSNGEVAQAPILKPRTDLLELVSTVVIPATTNKLVAKDRFVVNTKRNAPVKISYLGDNFTAWFLNGDGKTEDPISEQTLRYVKLRKASVDGPIIEELGGETKVETTLSEMFSLMEKQAKGEDGVLLNNGWSNLFYIKDGAGLLRAVDVRWSGGGWAVYADPVGRPLRWDDGDQVFSRNSALKSLEPVLTAS